MKKIKINFIGFPGWHIECSAMSMKYLGESFDIHMGGEDHISVHHTNEIAQSEAATGKKFVNFWLHGAFLTFKGEKVSKSKGGLYTISELEKMGFNPLAYRYLCLTAHYRSPLDFSLKNLESAKKSYGRMKNIIADLKDDGKINKKYLENFKKAVNDDMDMPKTLAILWNLLRDKKANGKIKTIKEMDKVLGLNLIYKPINYILKTKTGSFKVCFSPTEKNSKKIPENIKDLLEERGKYRQEKNWEKSDELRKKIEKSGYKVEDTIEGPKLKKL